MLSEPALCFQRLACRGPSALEKAAAPVHQVTQPAGPSSLRPRSTYGTCFAFYHTGDQIGRSAATAGLHLHSGGTLGVVGPVRQRPGIPARCKSVPDRLGPAIRNGI